MNRDLGVCRPGDSDLMVLEGDARCAAPYLLATMDCRCYNSLVSDAHLSNDEDDARFMRLALEQAAHAASLGEVPIGAVAVHRGQVVGAGYNRKEYDQDPTAHAEMDAIRQAARALQNWRLLGVTLYCTVEPCPMCAGAMIQARLERLVYGAPDVRFGAAGTIVDVLGESRFNHRVAVQTGVLADEAAALLQQFFRQLRVDNNDDT